MKKKIAIFGGGGFGREIGHYFLGDVAVGRYPGIELAGVVDSNPECELVRCSPEFKYLGDLGELKNPSDYCYLVAVGTVKKRKKIAIELQSLGLELFTYIHSNTIIASDARIGLGSIIGPGSIVNTGASIGICCAINVFCSIGHDAVVGAYSVLSPYSAMNGNSEVGESCFLGTRATLFPGTKIGKSCIVDSHSFVKASLGDRKIISARCKYLVVDNRMGD